jgi:hypothetical protein
MVQAQTSVIKLARSVWGVDSTVKNALGLQAKPGPFLHELFLRLEC